MTACKNECSRQRRGRALSGGWGPSAALIRGATIIRSLNDADASELPWFRYADDGLVHYRNNQQAEALKAELSSRVSDKDTSMSSKFW